MNNKLKIIAALFVSSIAIVFVIVWDLYLKDHIDSERVVIVKANSDIQRGQTLTKDMFEIETRPKSALVEGVVKESELNHILGKDAAERLIKNAQLSTEQVDFDRITPNKEEGEAIRPIPNEWIFAKPGSLRAKDQISIYAFTPSSAEEVVYLKVIKTMKSYL
ncbi:SAF domain-containing protein [Alkalihalobacillus oceani]|uniref:SAF domain-containing protein n=1 Tax=Halalkalibacter oceani TaxID=1653776 RepID=A0A9X2IQF5_9BACI|nr:SAF domain-containing protein [Halalkalibacter oceani]MCM3715432.1 SAF domain-containing protein [Halalkalibacter oceani]